MTLRAAALLVLLAAWPVATVAQAQDPAPGRQMPSLGQEHVPDGTHVEYPSYPPTSGTHWPRWADWGVHPDPVPEEMLVHNLEHGGVVLLYRCSSPCPDVVQELSAIFRALPASKYGHVKVIVCPNVRIGRRFALLAWTRLDEFDTVDRERVLRFVRAYQDKGPEDVP